MARLACNRYGLAFLAWLKAGPQVDKGAVANTPAVCGAQSLGDAASLSGLLRRLCAQMVKLDITCLIQHNGTYKS
jgi:hypothetical protein